MTKAKVQSSKSLNGSTEKITVDQFGNEFSAIINAYEKDLSDNIREDIRASGRKALKEVKKPPAGAGKYHDWGEYSSGWRNKYEDRYGAISIRTQNTKKPGLTHLLEKGHVVHTKDENDGKSYSRRFPHIERAADMAFEELNRRISEKGGRLK